MKYIHFILITFSLIVILKCQKEITVSCTDSPKTLKLLDSQSFIASCPQNCGGGLLWGTDIYTTDSAICKAGLHTGLLDREKGGSLKVTLLPGQNSYSGKERNGVKSSDWGSYSSSFKLE
ncbi:MAG: hypothetical protein H7A25_01940 [Leptospiraceae bacterium]|nr:hypothetical protein [Leptospiraceae bacterium]MCP5498637.1 hypothetical protein [Leptospiraceae bacterium]